MDRHLRIIVMAATAPCMVLPALAQTSMMGMARQNAANQLGVLEYCQAKGYADRSAIATQKSVIAQMPVSTESTLASENSGKQGTISANGTSVTLASMAKTHKTTVAALCGQLAQSTSQTAVMRQKMGNMPMGPGNMPAVEGMPTTPGGTTPGGIKLQGLPATPPTAQ